LSLGFGVFTKSSKTIMNFGTDIAPVQSSSSEETNVAAVKYVPPRIDEDKYQAAIPPLLDRKSDQFRHFGG
jgi:hypothetical protein